MPMVSFLAVSLSVFDLVGSAGMQTRPVMLLLNPDKYAREVEMLSGRVATKWPR